MNTKQRVYIGPEKLGIADLQLVGLANDEGAWTAYAYGLSRVLKTLAAGQALLDGRVLSVGPTSATLETSAHKRLELLLRK